MEKTVAAILIFCSLISLQTDNLYSALTDFKKGVEKEESEKAKKSDGGSSSKSSSSSLSVNDDDNGCGGAIAEVLLYSLVIWGIHNFNVRYNKYPYQFKDSNNFIYLYEGSDNTSSSRGNVLKPNTEIISMTEPVETGSTNAKNIESVRPEKKSSGFNKGTRYEDKNYYYTLEAGSQYAFDDGAGAFAGLRGKFYKLIGPELEAKRIIDGKDYLDYFAFGLNIPICQFSGFLPDFYVQKTYLKGILERDGWAYGIIINSYPIKPFSFMVRVGKQNYNNIRGENYGKIDFIDYEGRVGVLYNRFEIYAGYRHLGAKYAKLRGPVCGLKVFI